MDRQLAECWLLIETRIRTCNLFLRDVRIARVTISIETSHRKGYKSRREAIWNSSEMSSLSSLDGRHLQYDAEQQAGGGTHIKKSPNCRQNGAMLNLAQA